jgi:malonate transporter
MSDLFGIIGPVFALVMMGRLTVRYRLMDTRGLRGLNDFVFYAALPCLLFGSVAEAPQVSLVGVAAAYVIASMIVYLLAMLLGRLLLGARLAQGAMIGLNAAYGNTVMMGIPIVIASFGTRALAPLFAIITVHSAILLPLATVLIEIGSSGRSDVRSVARVTWRGVVRNPVILSIFLALLWRISGLAVPKALHGLLTMLGGAGPPLALFCLGASLPSLLGRGTLAEGVLSSILKLLVLPGLVWLLDLAIGVSGVDLAVSVLAAGMPTGANAFLLARRAGTLIEASAATVVLTTVLSLCSLSALLVWVRH